MNCPFCGVRLDNSPKCCSSCGRDIGFINEEASTVSRTAVTDAGSIPAKSAVHQFMRYRELKEKMRKKFSKPQKKSMKTVKISVGIMVKAKHGLKPIRGKTLPLDVGPQWSSEQLLAAASKRLKDFDQDMEDREYVLLYPDGSQTTHIPGTETPFTIEKYKKAIGKAYQRITMYICTLEDLSKSDGDDSEDEEDDVVVRVPPNMAPLSDTVIKKYCPFCGVGLDNSPKSCSSCGRDIGFINEEASTVSRTAGSIPAKSAVHQFMRYRELKEKKKFSKPQKNSIKSVKISVGIMVKAKHGLKPIRGKTLPLDVGPQWSSEQLLAAASKRLKYFDQDMEDREYVLLYPDGSQTTHIPGTETPFTIEKYKKAIGKAYQRITLYICPLEDLSKSDGDDRNEEEEDEEEDEVVVRVPPNMAPLSDTVIKMYCPFCGVRLDNSPKSCSSCGRDIGFINEEASTVSRTAGSIPAKSAVHQFMRYRELKEKKRKTFSKPQKKSMKSVKISVGIMVKAKHGLKPIRGKTVPLDVGPQWSSEQLLAAASKRLKDFDQDMEDREYVLLYPDGSQTTHIPGTETPFTIEKYKKAIGKAYQRITLYICTLEDLSKKDCFLNRSQFAAGFSQRLVLREGSVPTLSGQPGHSGDTGSPPHEERLSRAFDEVMGLGNFAETSRSSATSSKSGDQDETKGADETSGQEEQLPVEEEDSNGSRQEEKMDEVGESSPPRIPSPPPERNSPFTARTNEGGGGGGGGGGGSGGAAFDDALDGLPMYGPEEDDEDWHFALPMGTLEDVDVDKANRQRRQTEERNNSGRVDPFAREPRGGVEERVREESTESANTSHSSQDHTPDNSRDGGVLNQGEETEDSQQGERSEAAPMEDSNPPMSPSINIKDEPIDEGYDAALLPQSSIRQIKEELEHQEEELRISSVYSVGGANTFVSPAVPAAIPPPTPAAIFIPGRGTVLQAMASLPVRPPLPIPGSLPALATVPQRPPQPPVPGSVHCSGCSKVLLKGQTAFQRKGSTQLFCSTVCLTGHLPPATKNRLCFQCNREILQPRDMITIPVDDNAYMHFCGQFCLSVFRHKKKSGEKIPDKLVEKRLEKKPEKPPEKPVEQQSEKPFCSVCKVTKKQIEHEVTHQGRLHRLCSDACFLTWRKIRHLAMNCCEGCGLYCNSSAGSCQTLTIDRSKLNFCSPTCVGTYKQTCKKTVNCAYCHKMAIVSSTIMERDQRGKVQLYCSSVCMEQSRPPRHTLSGTPFPCSLCKVSAVPQYHLAMVDGTIRNFCSYDCVSIFRKSGHPSQLELTNGISSLRDPSIRDAPKTGPSAGASSVPPIPQDYPSSVPYPGHHPSHTSVPPLVPPYPSTSSPSVPGQAHARGPLKPTEGGNRDASKLTCHQCSQQFNTKPLLFSHQGHISMFCSTTCCEYYKTQKNIILPCECCKQEKVPFDIISCNLQDLVFCSENCKLLYKQDLTSRNKDHSWHPCSYCSGISQKMLHSHYGGKIEEFCKPHCMSQYTVLYYGMGRCDSCRKQGYMAEKLQCLGSVRNFCNLPCLLQYCSHHFDTSHNNNNSSSNGTGTAPQTPYAPTQPHHPSKMNPVIADVVSLASGSATQPSVSADTALTGALPTSIYGKNHDHASTQTDAMRLPVSRRRQMKNKSVLCRPFTMDQEIMCQLPSSSTESEVTSSAREEKVKVIMVPVPVPVFIPVPMNMYSQYTPVPMAVPMPIPVPLVVPPQKKEMKDAVVQSEPLAVKEDKHNEKPFSSAGQSISTADGKSQVVDPVITEEEDTQKADLPSTESPERGAESTDPLPDAQPGTTTTTTSDLPTTSVEQQPPSSPMMDLEMDFPSGRRSSAPQRGVKRPREGGYSGRKRGRRRTGSLGRGAVEPPAPSALNHLYGVKAWKSWVQQRNKQSQASALVDVKEDILQCDSAELSFALSRFIREVRRPNGETYSPDSIFYLCLGIQQYLFTKGRIENIFTDELYSQFATEITRMLQFWRPKLLPRGGAVSSRVEESYLWECKQLGAYSPIVLLNTLLFFCTKNFHFSTLAQHQSLSFVNFSRRSKPCSRAGKVHYLQYQGSGFDTERLRKRQAEKEGDMEMIENITNPLHCPVRLYEFYLSRCPESVKKRSDVFYLQPEQNVHTHSPHWYTSHPLEETTLQSMLTRILAVREAHQAQGAAQYQSPATTADRSSQ
ncbi:zinc finger MYM-type protein 4 isoform X3 [Scophthalmus maximus]|uniref:zinc finger MYM-type protein 4 isoform X3 n=1 Tax=Scophthalmus maximus TaxID=52904 RepID=UPI001FA88468|nr:zinc finger MYM-type protein 4 isoform X3 [Scophthalmus maximus]